ncbi:amino acid decarboxylase [Wenjunlia vitaminophila]|uniref:Amino acid decarboxylase n=1 Tax=Wenjunlia vitaminophila TaxID=76728 RepID=A0A0T6LT50_WENVI|nr:aminotransferase class V-fold PLP-dependent enzyme [Wenjunlia vitaminophila]KRV49335.1 amino acid decarboxylase [Wenjunlia vitaminophila]
MSIPAPRPEPADTALAATPAGIEELRRLGAVTLDALAAGAAARGGPLPPGGPAAVARRVRRRCAPVLPDHGVGAEAALSTLVRTVTEGSADPADPACAGHLHCPPLALAVAAELAACALNPSLDSWDQAPAASALEEETTAALAALVYPGRTAPDALITSGGTESNLVALLLARERARRPQGPPVQVVCGANAHHSVHRAAWMLGLAPPVVVDCPDGRLGPDAVDRALADVPGPALVVATAGTTDAGLIDPLPELARVAAARRAELHVDAAYGGALLFSRRLAGRLDGLASAATVALDLHKLGWQPIAAGALAVADAATLAPLAVRADYLNAADDTDAGLPDLLGRSPRTSRRPDVLKVAVTLRALGRTGLGRLVEDCVDAAERLAGRIDAHPALRRRPGPCGISTVLFRPVAAAPDAAGDALVAEVRRRLLTEGRAVLGRSRAPDADGRVRLWLKATLLHPHVRGADLDRLLALVTDAVPAALRELAAQPGDAATGPAGRAHRPRPGAHR